MIGIIVPSEFESKVITHPHHVSGMGKIKATCAVYDLVKGYDEILLTGFCGGIKGVKVGDIVKPNTFIEGDYRIPLEEYPHWISRGSGCTMISQDEFLTYNYYDFPIDEIVTDMESYAVAYTCRKLGIKFSVLKCVSDIVGSNSTKDFLDSCKSLAPKLNTAISKIMLAKQA